MELRIFDLGLKEYQFALTFQKKILHEVKSGITKSALIICSHFPVITLGRLADKNNILFPEQAKEIPVLKVERAGDVTYHGPGQLTVYPIFNLRYFKKDIRYFLRQLEETAIDFFNGFGVKASRREGLTGAWIGNKKIASIGVSISSWVSFHGLTMNIKACDLANFQLIRPCGMDIEMTCLENELGKAVSMEDVRKSVAGNVKKAFKI